MTTNNNTVSVNDTSRTSVIILLDHDPDTKLNQLLKQTMNANKQYTLDKFIYLFERSFSLRFKPIPIEFVSDMEVVCTYLHLNMFGFLQQRSQHCEWNRKSIVMELVTFYGLQLMNVSKKLKNDRQVVLAAVSNNGQAIKFASDTLKNDREIVEIALKHDGLNYEHIGEEWKSDPHFVEMALKKDGLLLKLAPKSIVNEKRFVEMAIQQNPNAILFAPPEMVVQQQGSSTTDNNSLLEECLKKSPLLLVMLVDSIEAVVLNSILTKEFVMDLVSIDVRVYQFLPPPMKEDVDVIIVMLSKDINAVHLLTYEVLGNEESMIEILQLFPQCYCNVPFNLKTKETIIKAVEIGKDQSQTENDADEALLENPTCLLLDRNRVMSWLTTSKLTASSNSSATNPNHYTTTLPTSPYKENARLIMHFGNAYYSTHHATSMATNFINNNNQNSTPSGGNEYGRSFPIQVNKID